jgi:hypothetical protein
VDVPVVFSDILTFHTKLNAGIDPTLTLNSASVGSFTLKSVSFFGDAQRTDTHKLTVVLSRDPNAGLDDESAWEAEIPAGGALESIRPNAARRHSKGSTDPRLMAVVRRYGKLSALYEKDPAEALRVAGRLTARLKQRRESAKRKEAELLNTLRGAPTGSQPVFERRGAVSVADVGYGTTSFRAAKMVEALSLKEQYGRTQVYLELERRRSAEEEARYFKRLREILQTAP